MNRAVLPMIVLLLASGCSREQAPAPVAAPPPAPASADQTTVSAHPMTAGEARKRAQDIESRRAQWRSVPGRLQVGDASSQFVAVYDAGVLRMIEERSEFDDYGSGTARYYLDTTGTLFLYDARDERAVNGAGAREVTELSMVFESNGRMVASRKTVDGRVQPVQAEEIDAAVSHLQALRQTARTP
jgi:hypothetical protein